MRSLMMIMSKCELSAGLSGALSASNRPVGFVPHLKPLITYLTNHLGRRFDHCMLT